ncbi:site-specific integrase [Loigolactobacillus coryniformis]|uniref:site-specific integrase n=1 Tax=Loigolactobacillus coryniformis TaxID=1610 RepID=UPI00201A4EA0|nr:site-specific integrase [Loigolactobacillus coryniformis]MCL5457243.1 site-specific integrase [Loigolactobacillus coryniformis]MDC4184606.1 site-specific integrase [Loigolactobacillus coryniformis]
MILLAYPYQKNFQHYLAEKELADVTITEYARTLDDFFNYLHRFNWAFSSDPSLDNILENDVRDYLSMLLSQRELKNDTYNKILSHLNGYFKFLFTHELIAHYPTVALKGLSKETLQPTIDFAWLAQLPTLLTDQRLSYYTRALLLFSTYGFTSQEILAPGFAELAAKLPFTPVERDFIHDLHVYLQPLQTLQNSTELFLKTRLDRQHPQLTAPALHKYLKKDAPLLDFALTPRKLHQGYILHYLLQHRAASATELQQQLRLDPASLDYYRSLLP